MMTNIEHIRRAGTACAIGGLLWFLTLMVDVVATDVVHGSDAHFRLWVATLLLMQLLLLAGLVGFAGSSAVGGGWLGRLGLGLALLGRAMFVLAEVQLFIEVDDYTPLLTLGAMVTAVGMILAGVAVLRAGRWRGWRRPLPLLTGLYPFIAMFPLFAATGERPTVMVALWGVPWLLLGIAIHAEASGSDVAPSRPLGTRPHATT